MFLFDKGFLKTRSGNRPSNTGGNLALRDLACALRWARNNLQSFGGDPSRLTLLGHGVGAALANLLLLTTEAKGSNSHTQISSDAQSLSKFYSDFRSGL